MGIFRPPASRRKSVSYQPRLTFALNAEGRLVYIDEVANGNACGCRCPHCHGALIARNEGTISQHHFAHVSGLDCEKGKETALHLLTKEIVCAEHAIMLPPYKSVHEGCLQHFEHIEVETRNDATNLQPDLVGITTDRSGQRSARLLIEVRVHHAVDAEKVRKIKNLGLPCIEIDMRPLLKVAYTREDVRRFVCESRDHRSWINNPKLEARQQEYEASREAERRERITELIRQESEYPGCQCLSLKACRNCRHHSLYDIVTQEISQSDLPSWTKEILGFRPVELTKSLVCREQRLGIRLPRSTYPLHHTGDIIGSLTAEDEAVYAFFDKTLPRLATKHLNHCTNALQIVSLDQDRDHKVTYVLCDKYRE